MPVRRMLAAALATLSMAACSVSPTESIRRSVDARPAVTTTVPADSTQVAGRGHMFGSGT